MLGRRMRGIALKIEGWVLLREVKNLMVGHQKAILTFGPDRMLDWPFPYHARRADPLTVVLDQISYSLDLTSTDQDTARAFEKRDML